MNVTDLRNALANEDTAVIEATIEEFNTWALTTSSVSTLPGCVNVLLDNLQLLTSTGKVPVLLLRAFNNACSVPEVVADVVLNTQLMAFVISTIKDATCHPDILNECISL